MRNPVLRRTLRITVTVLGLAPPVWRELIVDRDLSLAELHTALALAMDWPADAHHVFTDREPLSRLDDVPWNGYGSPRRWGDRWTMIDWRDPEVIESHTVCVGPLLDEGPLFHGCDVAGLWWCRIEARGDDIELVDAPLVRLTTGSGRAPLPGGPDVDELPRMHAILSDPAHDEHARVTAEFARVIGPWTTYVPTSSDLESARRAVSARFGDADRPRASPRRPRETRVRTRADALVDAVPPAARRSLRDHLDRVTASNPGPIDPDALADTLRPFSWLVSTIGDEGAPLVDGFLAPELAREGARALDLPIEAMRELVVQARDLRLVRRWRGRLVMLVAAEPVRASPLALWNHLARTVWQGHDVFGSVHSEHEVALLLLAIADGSLSDPRVGARRLEAALDLLPAWGYDEPRSWALPVEGGRRSALALDAPRRSVNDLTRAHALAFLGLVRDAHGTWQTPPGLRAFAIAALATEVRPGYW